MHRITTATHADLYDIAASRRIEAASTAGLPPHTLMRRAGLAVARLAMALTPHARTIWIACGPGNNGGDGLEAAVQMRALGFRPVVTLLADPQNLPPDASDAYSRAVDAGVEFADQPPADWELGIDAMLGLGAGRAPEGRLLDCLIRLRNSTAPLLCIDLPSGLNADTGFPAIETIAARASGAVGNGTFCLQLLTLKPGAFTASGRDAAGQVWFDDLSCSPGEERAVATLCGAMPDRPRRQATNKGSFGDVAVIGGAPGMVGGALLAATAALHAGAGRVLVGLLGAHRIEIDQTQPDLMLRDPNAIDVGGVTTVCGCGGGDDVRAALPRLLSRSPRLVLDADALNAIAADAGLQTLLTARGERTGQDARQTVLTPHPLEAARLLGCDASAVQRDRLTAARTLVGRFQATVVLKGSGTVVAAPDGSVSINGSGNARLAIAGTGDVLAGMVGTALAQGEAAADAARSAVWRHGDLADRWPADRSLTAAGLARGTARYIN